jgi:hypothetical protein
MDAFFWEVMALARRFMEITNSKVWTKTRLTATGTSTRNAQNILFERIYKHLAANCGWTVVSSSNGVDTAGAGDNIGVDNPAHIVAGAEGVNHSWVLLQNDHIATGFQALFNFWSYASGTESVKCEVSLVGFTGGSLQYKPTSTFSYMVGTWWKTTSALLTFSANVFNSSDFECTRWFIGPTTVQGYAIFDRPMAAQAWFTKPHVAVISRKLATMADFDAPSCVVDSEYVTIGTGSPYLFSSTVGASGDNGGSWSVYPMFCYSSASLVVGFFGYLADLWWAPTPLLTGDTFPGPGNDIKTQVVIGNMVLGNDGTALVL